VNENIDIDDEILQALGKGEAMTYVVANRMRMDNKNHNGSLKTARVLRRLKALELLGKVKRVRSVYAVQICWTLTPNAELTGRGTEGT